MWGTATFVAALVFIGIIIGTDVLRGIVDRHRTRATGYGGTQDIAMWGTVAALVWLIVVIVCGGIWIASSGSQ